MESNGAAKKSRVQRSEADWKTVLARYDESGQTRAAFCRREGLPASSFILWERKLRRTARRSEFVDVTPAPQPTARWSVEFQFPDGTTARVRG
jgi:hypothetical protein